MRAESPFLGRGNSTLLVLEIWLQPFKSHFLANEVHKPRCELQMAVPKREKTLSEILCAEETSKADK
jgi:hypothetical protein